MLKNYPVRAAIRSVIAQKKLKQSDIAQAAGYDCREFTRMLLGITPINASDIKRIASALDVDVQELFGSGKEQR